MGYTVSFRFLEIVLTVGLRSEIMEGKVLELKLSLKSRVPGKKPVYVEVIALSNQDIKDALNATGTVLHCALTQRHAYIL